MPQSFSPLSQRFLGFCRGSCAQSFWGQDSPDHRYCCWWQCQTWETDQCCWDSPDHRYCCWWQCQTWETDQCCWDSPDHRYCCWWHQLRSQSPPRGSPFPDGWTQEKEKVRAVSSVVAAASASASAQAATLAVCSNSGSCCAQRDSSPAPPPPPLPLKIHYRSEYTDGILTPTVVPAQALKHSLS